MDYSIIIPVFNEQEVLSATYRRLKEVMEASGGTYEMIFVDDGSRDNSAQTILNLRQKDANVRLLRLSKNFGQQAAMTAGLDYASGNAIVFIDADLQDPPEVILEMIRKWKEGYEVIYGKRIKRRGESFFKKATALLFYRILKNLTRENLPVDVGDFRLIDRKVANALKGIREKNRYMRGLMGWVGFKQAAVEYVRGERLAGVTKYSLRKMLRLSIDAITSFSYKPLKIATYAGFMFSLCSLLSLMMFVYLKFVRQRNISEGLLLLGIIFFQNSIILIVLGLMGEYIARIFEEVRDRPLYIILEKSGFSKEDPEGNA